MGDTAHRAHALQISGLPTLILDSCGQAHQREFVQVDPTPQYPAAKCCRTFGINLFANNYLLILEEMLRALENLRNLTVKKTPTKFDSLCFYEVCAEAD
mmetsp:Transcript_86370/g.150512  ORF Transcript_86370/g.150512 Transcript_86370/m.150512 type:complete len:99 (-) Transcript_86370:318-614(-)